MFTKLIVGQCCETSPVDILMGISINIVSFATKLKMDDLIYYMMNKILTCKKFSQLNYHLGHI